MTAFVYGTWSWALSKLSESVAEDLIDPETGKNMKESIQEQIEKNPFKAADKLEDALSPHNLKILMAELFSPEKLSKAKDQLEHEAISYLPVLFAKNLIFTTNFDLALETVFDRYECSSFKGRIGMPGRNKWLQNHLVSKEHGLFKLHGTIDGNNLIYEEMVFTQKQYLKAYRKGKSLRKNLMEIFQSQVLFFLGCSLEQDKTLEVLDSALILNNQVENFAILPCKKENLGQRYKELGDHNITAILYPDGKYESVKIILNRLASDSIKNEAIELAQKKTMFDQTKAILQDDLSAII